MLDQNCKANDKVDTDLKKGFAACSLAVVGIGRHRGCRVSGRKGTLAADRVDACNLFLVLYP